MTIVEEIDKLSGRERRSKNIQNAIDYLAKVTGGSNNISEAIKRYNPESGLPNYTVKLAVTGTGQDSVRFFASAEDPNADQDRDVTGLILVDWRHDTTNLYMMSGGDTEDVSVMILPEKTIEVYSDYFTDTNTTVTGAAELLPTPQESEDEWYIAISGDCTITVALS